MSVGKVQILETRLDFSQACPCQTGNDFPNMLGTRFLLAICVGFVLGRVEVDLELCMGYTRLLIDGMACDELATNITLLLALL
jgi:hypothetical protein